MTEHDPQPCHWCERPITRCPCTLYAGPFRHWRHVNGTHQCPDQRTLARP